MMPSPFLSGIYIYPVKSLAGIAVDRWPVTEKGLRYDRQWMLVDKKRKFLSQRCLPKMALIRTALSESCLTLSAPGLDNLALPLEATNDETLECEIWHDRCLAHEVSKQANRWLSDFLHIDCKLVYQAEETIRPVDPNYARPDDKVYFSDGFPFLILSENTLASLNRAMNLNYPMARFRPNLVLSGCDSYAEDSWRTISIGDINFRLPKPCARCSVPTIDPETAESGPEPLLTLSRIRKWNQKVYFGQNALHDNTGVLHIGDSVAILSTGPKQPPLDQL
ncbi:MOSC N-terminal beta barrel domain-containing protein [Methylotuvimicrobium sp. KM2]|uniref:MOSC domain-containing protein n=1 Tax=Methylotuvimicrobium sp. KM2 TaxID=3133976 RepID=UPI003100AE81